MAEEYSEVWITVKSGVDPRAVENELNAEWRELLDKYEEYDIVNDTGSIRGVGDEDLDLQIDGDSIVFGLGAHRKNGNPNYMKQYQAVGEMIWRIQRIMEYPPLNVEVQKTGASG